MVLYPLSAQDILEASHSLGPVIPWHIVLYVLGLVWLTGSRGGKRHFLRSKEGAFCLVGVLRGERVKNVLSIGSYFSHFIGGRNP